MASENETAPYRARAYDRMLLVTYSIRPGSEARGYEDWLRRVDNPFFNASPGVFHYVNWKPVAGADLFPPQTHLDFLGMVGEDALEQVMNGTELNRFRDEWRRLWGIADPTDHAANSQPYLFERVATAPDMAWTGHVVLCPGAVGETRTGWDSWKLVRTLRGPALGFPTLHVRYLPGPDAFAEIAATADRTLLARCIAAPGFVPSTV